MPETFIKLFRKAVENDLFNEKPFDRWHAFEWLLLKAYKFPQDIIIKGRVVHIGTGQYIISQRKLAETFGWSVNKLIRFQKLLQELKMATFDGDTYGDSIGTLVTIENYTKYQGYEINGGDTNGNTNGDNIKKVKKDKKEKKYIMPAMGEFENVLLTEEELEKLKERFPYDCQGRIDRLSAYMASKGKRYKSHYATILTWARKETEGKEDKPKGRLDWIDDI